MKDDLSPFCGVGIRDTAQVSLALFFQTVNGWSSPFLYDTKAILPLWLRICVGGLLLLVEYGLSISTRSAEPSDLPDFSILVRTMRLDLVE